MKPRGRLAAQMGFTAPAGMECLRRAAIQDHPSHAREANLALAAKLIRTYGLTLQYKHRGKGQQTVRVEHVTVKVGQAIVGNVKHSGER